MWWVYVAGVVLMAALGPSPRWLSAEFIDERGRNLPGWQLWALWAAQALLWPAALAWYARQWMYGH